MRRAAIGPRPHSEPARVATDADQSGAGDFDRLLARYSGELQRYAWRLTRNRADAEDLYQETVLKALRGFPRPGQDALPRPWLYRICTTTFLDSKRRDNRITPLDDDLELAAPLTDPAAEIDARDLLRDVNRFVAGLPPKQQIALVLRKFHELDYAEIAGTLHCSETAARANVYEALRKLRQAFGDRADENE